MFVSYKSVSYTHLDVYKRQHIDLVEIDKMVVDACLEYLPDVSGKLLDKKVTIHIDDGLRYVRSCENQYDLIIVDSTDPVGPGEGLFTKEFYGNCYNCLLYTSRCV